MPTPQELEKLFWKSLKSDMTMMLGLDGIEDGHARPMTAQLDGERGPIWFFTAKDNAIVQKLGHGPGKGNRAIVTFASKGHEIRVMKFLRPFTARSALTTIAPPSTGCGTGSSRHGSRAAKTIQSSRCCGSTPNARRFGSMRPASSPASNFSSAPTRSKTTRTRSLRFRCGDC